MKKYIGTKQIEAEPMTVNEFYHLTKQSQYGEMVENGEGDLNGYHIVYEDGFEGWVPEDEFKKSYKVADTFLDRLHIEHSDLMEKFEKCAVFVDSEKFRETIKDDYPAFLLWLQRKLMERYGAILKQRIGIAKNENDITSLPRMSFGIAIEAMKFGLAIRREDWYNKRVWVIKQVPALITEKTIPGMQSLPQSAKDLIMKSNGYIDYTNQCLIYNENTGRADSWVPSISDVFAKDWEIVL